MNQRIHYSMLHIFIVCVALLTLDMAIHSVDARDWTCPSRKGVKQTIKVADQSGSISDGPGGIHSNSWCEFFVEVPQDDKSAASRIMLTFSSVGLLSGDDFIWVYDDAVSNTVPIERITGTYIPKPLYSASILGFRVEFRSSSFGLDTAVAEEVGFEAKYERFQAKGVCNKTPCSAHSTCVEDKAGKRHCTHCQIGFTGDSSKPNGCVAVRKCDKPYLRKEIRSLSAREKKIFMDSLQEMRRSGVYDQIMWVHADKGNFNYAHLTDGFLPWHRKYLLMFEEALRSVSPESFCVTVPFWDWTIDAAKPLESPIFTDLYFGGTGVDRGNGKSCVASGPFKDWTILGNDCLQRTLNSAGFIATREEILNVIASQGRFREFSRAIELFHDTVHRFIGGSMILDNSADEPLFIIHHSFIDMLYTVWQDCHNYDDVAANAVKPGSDIFMGGTESGSLGVTVATTYHGKMPYRLSHHTQPVVPRDMHSNRGLNVRPGHNVDVLYDNKAFLTERMTIDWFDARWTTCTIENLSLFKSNPKLFPAPSGGVVRSAGFKALSDDMSGSNQMPSFQINIAPSFPEHRLPRVLPPLGPETLCSGGSSASHNLSLACNCFRKWTRDDLIFVSTALPSCNSREIRTCLGMPPPTPSPSIQC